MSKVKLCSLCLGILLVLPCLALAAAGTKPTINALSPTSATAGGATFVLTVGGSGFARGAVVLWNGSPLNTTYVHYSQLTATVPNTLIAAAGSATIAVYIAGRTGGTSGSVGFTISAATTTTTTTTTSPLAIASTSIPAGTTGTAYSATLTATGGTSPYTWSVSSGTLPTGLTLSSAGAISGTPTTSGSASFTAQVKDSASNVQTYTYSASIAAGTTTALSISTASLPGGTATTAYPSTSLAATGGTSPYTWSVASGSTLPAGLTLSTAGALSGTPTTANAYSFSLQVADSASHTATKAYSLTVATAATSTLASNCVNGTYGPCGDPYEGNGPPPNQKPISACGTTMSSSTNYVLTQDIGTDPTATCFNLSSGSNINVDLGGHTVTGAIMDGSAGNGNTWYNGTISCNRDSHAYPQACLNVYAQISTAQWRAHHLVLNQQNEGSPSYYTINLRIEMDNAQAFTGTGTGLGMACRADHIAITSITGTGVGNRYYGLDTLNECNTEMDHNYVHCTGGLLNACQGLLAEKVPYAYIHDNEVLMDPVSSTTQDGRAVMCDWAGVGGTCDIYNNLLTPTNNRAIRYRSANSPTIQAGNVYNNSIYNIQTPGRMGAIHIGENDTGLQGNSINVYNNSFELNNGNGMVVVSASGVTAYNNTITCYGGNCSSAGYPFFTDALGYSGGLTSAYFKNTTLASGLANGVKVCGLTSPYACTINTETTSATVCSAGTAVGTGTITASNTPCP